MIKSERLRKRTIFGEMQFRRLIEMLTETFETLAGFQQDSERNFSAAERIEEAQKPTGIRLVH